MPPRSPADRRWTALEKWLRRELRAVVGLKELAKQCNTPETEDRMLAREIQLTLVWKEMDRLAASPPPRGKTR